MDQTIFFFVIVMFASMIMVPDVLFKIMDFKIVSSESFSTLKDLSDSIFS